MSGEDKRGIELIDFEDGAMDFEGGGEDESGSDVGVIDVPELPVTQTTMPDLDIYHITKT